MHVLCILGYTAGNKVGFKGVLVQESHLSQPAVSSRDNTSEGEKHFPQSADGEVDLLYLNGINSGTGDAAL